MSDKYKELYELSKHIYQEELGRAYRFDDRASKLLPAYAVLTGILGLIIKWFFDNGLPLTGFLDYLIAILLCATIIFLIVGLCATIRVFIKAHNFHKLPLDESLLEFFLNNQLIDIHFALSKRIKEAYEKNYVTTNEKASLFAKVYYPTVLAAILLFLSLVLIGVNINYTKKAQINLKGEITMAENNNKPEQATNQTVEPQADVKPDPSVEAPPLRIVTESYKPSEGEIKKTAVIDSNKSKK